MLMDTRRLHATAESRGPAQAETRRTDCMRYQLKFGDELGGRTTTTGHLLGDEHKLCQNVISIPHVFIQPYIK